MYKIFAKENGYNGIIGKTEFIDGIGVTASADIAHGFASIGFKVEKDNEIEETKPKQEAKPKAEKKEAKPKSGKKG